MSIWIQFLFALFGGIAPAVIWLAFWLREDSLHPEPNRYILLTFFLGMVMVPLTLAIQTIISAIFLENNNIELAISKMPIIGLITLLLWSATEEFLKYKAARYGGLNRKSNDEPIDVVMYLITAALGFAAMENTLYLFTPIVDGNFEAALFTGNMRFIGATLLHVASSSIIGVAGAFSYFFLKQIRKFYIISSFIIASVLHALFNFLIIKYADNMIYVFGLVWLSIVVLFILFEKIKNIHLEKIEGIKKTFSKFSLDPKE